jgi:hypothetical protein
MRPQSTGSRFVPHSSPALFALPPLYSGELLTANQDVGNLVEGSNNGVLKIEEFE